MTVGLVLVSHVAELAEGVRRLAAQMAPAVDIAVAGGTEDGGVGTSFDATVAAIASADSGAGVVVLYDLGSALMTAELAVETLDEAQRERVRLVDAPLVEAAIAAATTAGTGAELDAVVAAAAGQGSASAAAETGPAEAWECVTLTNPLGLHARPAARLVTVLADFDAAVRVGAPGSAGVDARSVLGVVGLGLRGGAEVEVAATGPDATAAVSAVVALIERGFGETNEPVEGDATVETAETGGPEPAVRPDAPGALAGVAASPGVAVGPVHRVRTAEPVVPEGAGAGVELERERLRSALARVDAALAGRTGGTAADLAAAHRALLGDPLLRDAAMEHVAAGANAEAAWWRAVDAARTALAAGDALAAERGADVRVIGLAVLTELGVETASVADAVPAGAVVVTDELLLNDVEALAGGAAAVVTARGGATAHATILARGLGLPMVVSLGEAADRLSDGAVALVDGTAGTVDPAPAPEAVERARAAVAIERERRAADRAAARLPAFGPGGVRVPILANIATVADARAAVDAGADGVGLLRTELGYLERATPPSEDEQVTDLAAMLAVLGERPVVVRTLDVGGDKPMAGLRLDPVRHGMLGERGLRFARSRPDLLRTQLRAILRTGARFAGELSVMAPMVTVAAEAREFRATVAETAAELTEAGIAHRPPDRVGVMIEVPAAALLAAEVCAEVDFVSVGSNDLAQYVLAADRTNDAVAHLYRPAHPALWRLLELLVPAARAASCPVAVCGEIAGQAELAQRLVELGVHELSMAPVSIPRVKGHLRSAYGSAPAP